MLSGKTVKMYVILAPTQVELRVKCFLPRTGEYHQQLFTVEERSERSNVTMNISTGGPHILLFERDQQLTALCISEFQLAGYECHTARTAVEVFDAIARYPIRLVLVNLAQAAAARREFWVALDTQRRGRGVQVLTFQCFNLASYGPQDPEDRSQTVHADMEIDGMLGLMALVDAVRVRVPGAGATNTIPRIPRAGNDSSARPVNYASPQAATTTESYPSPSIGPGNITQQSSYTDKIHAVLYPGQRTQNSLPAQEVQSTLQRLANGNPLESQPESSLAQLSRMVQEPYTPIILEDTRREPVARVAGAPAPTQPPEQFDATGALPELRFNATVNHTPSPPPLRPFPITEDSSMQPLRASPIQDMPVERASGSQGGSESVRRVEFHRNHGQTIPTPLASIATSLQTTAREMPPPPPPAPIAASSAVENYAEEEEEVKDDSVLDKELTRENIQQASSQEQAETQGDKTPDTAANNTMLLNIVQSFPSMPPPPSQATQPQVLKSRAKRSLTSVLLEGHLVQQNRLEVAQDIQRMLRGVDLNYQLEEILLMFKLLTPDQLLAASLVSHGLITTAQISALGRIRQELHSIGLEYDLEHLLILFRIVSPEQLREVKSNWQE